MPISARGNEIGVRPPSGRSGRGFTLIELLLVLLLVAIGSSVVALAVRDGDSMRLEEEGARLASLLESARAEARASSMVVRWVPSRDGDATPETGFRFVGLPGSITLPRRWLEPRVTAQVVGSTTLLLGPDAILPAQRVVLSLGDHRIQVATDGLAPFAVMPAPEPAR